MNSRSPFLFVALLLAFVGCNDNTRDHASFPRRPIKVVVPFSAGGGSDTFGRIVQSAIEKHDLLPQPIVMINVPGAGGTIGSRRVKEAVADGYTILLLHEGILTAKFSGQAAYGPEAFSSIAGTGLSPQVIAVSKDSDYQDLKQLVENAANEPDSIVFSANIGAPSHFAGLMLEQQKAEAKFRYVQTGGGAKRFAALQGGHVDVTSFSLAEYTQFKAAGIRALAILSHQRDASCPELATASEQGFEVVSENMQFWWAPAGTPDDRIKTLATAIEQAMQTPEVKRKLAAMQIAPRFLDATAVNQDIEARSTRLSQVSLRSDHQLPDLPSMVLWATVVLGIVWLIQSRRLPATARATEAQTDWSTTLLVMLLVGLYVLALQFTGIGFRIATIAFVVTCGLAFYSNQPRRPQSFRNALATSAAVSCVVALGTHYLFTELLVIDLP